MYATQLSINTLRGWAATARDRGDVSVAEFLDNTAADRAAAARQRTGRGPGWVSAADVPDGVTFTSAPDPDSWDIPNNLVFRKEGDMCAMVLADVAVPRMFSPAEVDRFQQVGAGFVQVEQASS